MLDFIRENIQECLLLLGTMFGTSFGTYKATDVYHKKKNPANGTKAELKFINKELTELKEEKMCRETCDERSKAISNKIDKLEEHVSKEVKNLKDDVNSKFDRIMNRLQ